MKTIDIKFSREDVIAKLASALTEISDRQHIVVSIATLGLMRGAEPKAIKEAAKDAIAKAGGSDTWLSKALTMASRFAKHVIVDYDRHMVAEMNVDDAIAYVAFTVAMERNGMGWNAYYEVLGALDGKAPKAKAEPAGEDVTAVTEPEGNATVETEAGGTADGFFFEASSPLEAARKALSALNGDDLWSIVTGIVNELDGRSLATLAEHIAHVQAIDLEVRLAA